MSDVVLEQHKQNIAGERQFRYFLLTASGAAVGFAMLRSEGRGVNPVSLILLVSVLLWGLSFYFGCRNLQAGTRLGMADKLITQLNENISISATVKAARKQQLEKDVKRFNATAIRSGNLQYWFFFFGMLVYAVWHVLVIMPERVVLL